MAVLGQLAIEAAWVAIVILSATLALKRRYALAAVLLPIAILVLSNSSFLPYFFGLKNLFPVYHYVSSDRGFRGDECFKSSACYWSVLQRDFEAYSQRHPGVRLQRLEPIRPWAFWNWYDYATHPRWQLAYYEPGAPLEP